MLVKSLAITLLSLSTLLAQGNEIANLGAGLLAHTEVARQAVAHHDSRAALDQIAQALAAAEQIRAASNSNEEPLRVQIARDVDAVSTTVPAKRRGSADRLKPNSSVSQVSGSYNATVLNVSSARNHLLAAQTALSKGDMDAAAADLAAVEADKVIEVYNGDLPLMQARDNLVLALARVRDGKYKDAILPLKSASRAIDRYAHQEPRPHHADRAARVSLEVDALAEHIDKDHEDAAGRIAGWLSFVKDWDR
jgi:hypothetical protein